MFIRSFLFKIKFRIGSQSRDVRLAYIINKGVRLFFHLLFCSLLFSSCLSIFFEALNRTKHFSRYFFAASSMRVFLPCVVVRTPSSTKAGSEKKELAAFTSPSFATIFLRSPAPSPFQPPPSRRYLLPHAAPSLSSDFPHSIFAISTSDIENSQSGSAWSYSQWHYSVPLSHRPFPTLPSSFSTSLVSLDCGRTEPLGGNARTRVSPKWIDSSICTVRDYDAVGTPRCVVLHASSCCSFVALWFDKRANERNAPSRFCFVRVRAACIEIFSWTWLGDKWNFVSIRALKFGYWGTW